MTKVNWGTKSKENDKQFLKALLDRANIPAENNQEEFQWKDEGSKCPKLNVKTEKKSWVKNNGSDRLTYDQLRTVIKRLEKLKIIIDSDSSKGRKSWEFTLNLWSKDTVTNLSKFEEIYGKQYIELKNPKETEQGLSNNPSAVDTSDVDVEQSSDIEQQITDYKQISLPIFRILSSIKVENIDTFIETLSDIVPENWFKEWHKTPTEIGDIVQQLKEIPYLDASNPPVLKFACLLIKKNISQIIREEIEQVLPNKPSANETKVESILTRRLRSYLLIRFRPTGANELSVQAWCIPDDIIHESDGRFERLSVEPQQVVTPFKPEIMSPLLSNLIKQCYENHIKGRSADLTIEIFLPSDHLYDEVEKWSYEDDEEHLITIGKDHIVVVRSHDRLKDLYTQSITNWRNRWEEVQPSLTNILSTEQVITVYNNDLDCNALRNLLVRKKVLMVSCELDKTQLRNLLKAIHSAGTPIVIWSRCDVQSLSNPENFDALIKEPLCQLTNQVRQQRSEAKSDKDLGNHLILLWDDPKRIPTISKLEVPTS